MNVITIPKNLAKRDDLIVIPRQDYEALLRRQPKLIPIIKLTPREKRAIAKSEKELALGEYITLDQLEHELASTYTKKY